MKNLILMIALAMSVTTPCLADNSAASPGVTLTAAISADGPVFCYIPGKPYKLAVTVTNLTKDDLVVEAVGISTGDKGMTVDSKPDGEALSKVAANASSAANFILTLPDAAVNKQLTLECTASYSLGDKKLAAKCSLPVMVSPELEITLLPARLVLNPSEGEKRVGMSVINHGDAAFEGLVKLSCSPGLTVSPADFTTKIDSYGLEAFVFGVKPDAKIAPGHYAVFVNVGGKGKEWAAIDVPVIAKASPGCLEPRDANPVPSFSIAKLISTGEKPQYEFVGKGWIGYDGSSLQILLELDDAKHVQPASQKDVDSGDSIAIGFDPLMNGAKSRAGGYRDDDYEYAVADTKDGAVVSKTHGPKTKSAVPIMASASHKDGRTTYQLLFPWDELAPLSAKRGMMFGLSVLVNQSDGTSVKAVEWGGGMTGGKDPRMFIPVVLTQ